MNNIKQKKSLKKILRNITLSLFGLGYIIQAISFNLQKGKIKANQNIYVVFNKKNKLTKEAKLKAKLQKIQEENDNGNSTR